MTSNQIKKQIIDNFILHVTHSSEGDAGFDQTIRMTPEQMYNQVDTYIEEDHVDEIAQNGWTPPVAESESITLTKQKILAIKNVIHRYGKITFGANGLESVVYKELSDVQHLIEHVALETITVNVYHSGHYTDTYDLVWDDLNDDDVAMVFAIVEEFDDIPTEDKVFN